MARALGGTSLCPCLFGTFRATFRSPDSTRTIANSPNRAEKIGQTLSDFLCIHTHGHMVIYAFTIESLYTVLHPSLLMLYSPIPSVDDQPSEVLCHTAVVLGDRLGVAGSSGSTLLGEEVPETGASNADSSTSSAAPMSSAAFALDVTHAHVSKLEDVQNEYLRRLLGLNRRSVIAILFSETGIIPLRYSLQVTIPRYRLSITPDITRDGLPCWLSDLYYALSHLPVPVLLSMDSLTPDGIADLKRRLNASCSTWIGE
ncbi:hypothetical protein DFH08DRAFT_1024263 [Mycena albidolilacea]|uniref:Uncharacterized protein n=1 Tax=Mycena albidolilacea TaxID=1033008 RepID=A0AAD7AL74_9AGAR|nr:hypothetical protein DFH08DRAFT_1024263 [Mycena albidolilacea]